MSYAIVRRLFPSRSHDNQQKGGLTPPSAGPISIFKDLRWHSRIYREDGLSRFDRTAFLALRVLQRIAYNLGWRFGGER
jgi:hypothetical protein